MSSGVKNPRVVDLVTWDPKTNEFAVIMYEDRPWSTESARLDELIEKINAYVHFVESGELTRRYPKALGQSVRLQLDCEQLPPAEVTELIEQAQKTLRIRGVTFVVNFIRPRQQT